jgi:hypothetical protein
MIRDRKNPWALVVAGGETWQIDLLSAPGPPCQRPGRHELPWAGPESRRLSRNNQPRSFQDIQRTLG